MSIGEATLSVLTARIRYGLGSHFHSLFDLARVPPSEWASYIIDAEVNPALQAINRRHMKMADDKVAFAAHCMRNGLPTVPITCIIVGTRGGSAAAGELGTPAVSNAGELDAVLAHAPDELFLKLIDGAHGEHAFAATRSGPRWSFAGREGAAADLYSFCADQGRHTRGWIVQPALRPHHKLVPIMPDNALGTIRAVTYRVGGDVRIILPVLRIPASGNRTDNFSGGKSGNIVAPIDLGSGQVGRGRTSTSTGWPQMTFTDAHPDTGASITGFEVPLWEAAKEVMLESQQRTPEFMTVGWDVAVTETGPVIIEANPGYDTDLLQVAYARGIRADFAPIIALRPST